MLLMFMHFHFYSTSGPLTAPSPCPPPPFSQVIWYAFYKNWCYNLTFVYFAFISGGGRRGA